MRIAMLLMVLACGPKKSPTPAVPAPPSVEEAQPGFLGLQVVVLIAPDSDEAGPLTVRTVYEASPAATAGFQPGDIVRSVGQTPVADVSSFIAAVQAYSAGDTVAVSIERDGEPKTLEATLDPR